MVSQVERRPVYLNPDHFRTLSVIHDALNFGYEPRLKPFFSPWELVNKLRGKTSEGWEKVDDQPITLPRGKWRLSRFTSRLVKYIHARATGS